MSPIDHVRCSGLNRYMACPGFAFFKDLPEQESGAPAQEGTAAGEFLERLLTGTPPKVGEQARNGVMFDSDMEFYARQSYDYIMARAQSTVLCEQRIDWQATPAIQVRGSFDVSFFDHQGGLHIHDLKYGWKIVDVKENWQLLAYAIGALMRHNPNVAVPYVVLCIHQPRPHHEDGAYREWVLSIDQLLFYRDMIVHALTKIENGDNTLVTGPQCKYCPASNNCPAFNRAFYSAVDYVLSDFKQDRLTEKEIAAQLTLLARVSEIFKIKNDSLTQLAVDSLKSGVIIPGYSTEQNFGERKWNKKVSPDVIEALTGKKITKVEMLSPAQAVKVGVPKGLVNQLVERHFIGMKLVKKDSSKIGDDIFGKSTPQLQGVK